MKMKKHKSHDFQYAEGKKKQEHQDIHEEKGNTTKVHLTENLSEDIVEEDRVSETILTTLSELEHEPLRPPKKTTSPRSPIRTYKRVPLSKKSREFAKHSPYSQPQLLKQKSPKLKKSNDSTESPVKAIRAEMRYRANLRLSAETTEQLESQSKMIASQKVAIDRATRHQKKQEDTIEQLKEDIKRVSDDHAKLVEEMKLQQQQKQDILKARRKR
eukprot:CAMPEP_0117425926 /NCGR_PEP_ID=MMETSP0758-20121206/6135_1 /TAXON_ID=63605 /ORGANISM="Percolomonas cosmopolitus, Strain AE-1 (ATCC 50343)" /LENGTH=214 /DNA_ID=CAMNT_0005210773 /DNA_START=475 /DNA_END=1116 /DNA_ORIENTATION=-